MYPQFWEKHMGYRNYASVVLGKPIIKQAAEATVTELPYMTQLNGGHFEKNVIFPTFVDNPWKFHVFVQQITLGSVR